MTGQNPMTVNRAKEVAREVMRRGLPLGELDNHEASMKLHSAIATAIQSEVDVAVRAERERCVQIAENYHAPSCVTSIDGMTIAELIRRKS